jgi:hypothetical protein
MDADEVGTWMPFFIAILLLSFSGWGLWSIPENSDDIVAQSGENIPRFVEHFPIDMDEEIPLDKVIRMAWYPENNSLGTLKTDDRFLELGELSIVDHASEPATAILRTMIRWTSEQSINVTVEINMTSEIENGILRLILVEDDVEMFGRTPAQHSVVRLYDPTPIGDGNGTISRELTLSNGLSRDDAHRLQFVILLSDMMTEENHAAISMPMPLGNNGPSETGQRVSTVLALGAILLGMAAISRAEWKREVMLPKLRGGRDSTGQSIAFLKAGKRDVHLREVRVLAPWKLAKGIRSMDLPAGTEKTISVFVKPERGDTNPHTTIVETEWSIEVDEMGGWVLDLVLHKKPPT